MNNDFDVPSGIRDEWVGADSLFGKVTTMKEVISRQIIVEFENSGLSSSSDERDLV